MPRPSPYRQLPLTLPPSAPIDPLVAARSALAAAGRAAEQRDRRRATAALASHLAGVAQARGRTPVPKPGH
jgi:hypothetical protein